MYVILKAVTIQNFKEWKVHEVKDKYFLTMEEATDAVADLITGGTCLYDIRVCKEAAVQAITSVKISDT